LLYEAEMKSATGAETLVDQVLEPEAFVGLLVGGVSRRIDEIDDVLQKAAHDWDVARMSAIDRNILRLATFELMEEAQTPTAVIISEAVELAKRYSTDDSGRFVNGVLAGVASVVRAG
jgi:N utilization substance protein B